MNSGINESIPLNFMEQVLDTVGALSQSINSTESPIARFVDDLTTFYFKILVYILLSGFVSIIGIVTNTINIIIFTRQGIFTEGGSPSLLCLAVSDLCCVTFMLWLSVSLAIVQADPPGLSWEPWDIMYLTGGWPHLMFAQITKMVTAYVSFERCICVVFPFKVKSLFTPTRSILVTAGIFIGFMLSYSPVFIMQQLKYKFDVNSNSTRLVLVSSPQWQQAVDVMYYVNSITFNIGTVAIVLICTMVTVSRVNRSKAWRKSLATNLSSSKATASQSSQEMQNNKIGMSKIKKERKLVKIITLISVIFLVCYIPDFCFMLMFTVNPEIRIFGRHENLAMIMYSFAFLMETINSTMNIIVYLKMSSRYKQDFYALFGIKST